MSTGNNRLGNNILGLMRLHKISQNQLAEDLDIDKSTISKYISGKTTITRKHLEAIAEYFNSAPESILNDDFSTIVNDLKDPEDFYRNIGMLLPLFYKESKNSHYNNAFTEHHRLFQRIRELNLDIADIDFDMIENEYKQAMKSKQTEYIATANYLSFGFLSVFLMKAFAVQSRDYDKLPLVIRQGMSLDEHLEIQNDLGDTESEFSEIVNDPESMEELTGYYYKLKRKSDWADLADYYICLQFILGAFPNAFTDAQNKAFGIYLMSVFAACGNQYADNYLSKMITF